MSHHHLAGCALRWSQVKLNGPAKELVVVGFWEEPVQLLCGASTAGGGGMGAYQCWEGCMGLSISTFLPVVLPVHCSVPTLAGMPAMRKWSAGQGRSGTPLCLPGSSLCLNARLSRVGYFVVVCQCARSVWSNFSVYLLGGLRPQEVLAAPAGILLVTVFSAQRSRLYSPVGCCLGGYYKLAVSMAPHPTWLLWQAAHVRVVGPWSDSHHA